MNKKSRKGDRRYFLALIKTAQILMDYAVTIAVVLVVLVALGVYMRTAISGRIKDTADSLGGGELYVYVNNDPVCPSETNATFCANRNKNCNSTSGFDNCGVYRVSVLCGVCTAPDTCGGGGTIDMCGSPLDDSACKAWLSANGGACYSSPAVPENCLYETYGKCYDDRVDVCAAATACTHVDSAKNATLQDLCKGGLCACCG